MLWNAKEARLWESASPRLHLQGVVAARPFALHNGGQRGPGTRWDQGCLGEQPVGGSSPVGGACGVIWPLTSQGGGGPVAKGGVGVDTAPGVLRAPTGTAEEARRRPASRQLVHP